MANGMEPRPDEVPNPEAAAQGGEQSPTQLVSDINTKMLLLMDALGRAKGVASPEDSQKLASVIQGFQGFVEGLTQAPGASAPPEPVRGNSPMEAGASPNAVPAGPQI